MEVFQFVYHLFAAQQQTQQQTQQKKAGITPPSPSLSRQSAEIATGSALNLKNLKKYPQYFVIIRNYWTD
jgi:hypothetical protein